MSLSWCRGLCRRSDLGAVTSSSVNSCDTPLSLSAGPKTLCNACGVKRCRQMRVASDNKRRASTVQKPAPAVWHTQVRRQWLCPEHTWHAMAHDMPSLSQGVLFSHAEAELSAAVQDLLADEESCYTESRAPKQPRKVRAQHHPEHACW